MKVETRTTAFLGKALVCALLVSAQSVFANTFTYQGKLTDDGVAADGVYDFRFSIWTDSSGGTKLGLDFVENNLAVSDGLFIVDLTFTGFANTFDGSTRWLQIQVKEDSEGTYSNLLPRQPIYPSPHSVYAQTSSWGGLSNVPAGLDDGDDDTTYAASSGVNISGTTISLQYAGSGSATTVARSDHEHDSLRSEPASSSSDIVLNSNDDIALNLDIDGTSTFERFYVEDSNGLMLNVSSTSASYGSTTTVYGNLSARAKVFTDDTVEIDSPADDGLWIRAGTNPQTGYSIFPTENNAIEIAYAENKGIRIEQTGNSGIYLDEIGTYGIYIAGTGSYGLWVNSERSYFGNDTGIGTTPSARLHVRDSINGAASLSNHAAIIENSSTGTSPDALAIKIGEVNTGTNIGTENNFISFKEGNNNSMGAIQGNGSGSIQLAGPGNDYGEYLERMDPAETIEPGDIVGVHQGKVTRKTAGADQILVASTGAIVAGNDPGERERPRFTLVAFMGQADIRVRGPVEKGDLILPSGEADGTGVAVKPAEIGFDQISEIAGQAWESDDRTGSKQVRSLVGLVQPGVLATALGGIDERLKRVEAQLAPNR